MSRKRRGALFVEQHGVQQAKTAVKAPSHWGKQTSSCIHRWRPLPKLLGLLGLMVAFAGVQRLALLPVIGIVAAGLWRISGLPWRLWLQRLAGPGVLVSALILVLPFWLGETVIWRWGSLAVRWEGIVVVLRIGVRLGAIFTLTLLLLETTPLMELLVALQRLGIPNLLLELAWLTHRYLQELESQWQQMQRAARLRGWQPKGFLFAQRDKVFFTQAIKRDLVFLASLVGTLLVRSYERSERVYQALQLRGYGQGGVSRIVSSAEGPAQPPTSIAQGLRPCAQRAVGLWNALRAANALSLRLNLRLSLRLAGATANAFASSRKRCVATALRSNNASSWAATGLALGMAAVLFALG
ncbi:MAG: cobalt ECF transporter T component CbiQ [Cyanobacteriota bacterium]